MPFLSDAAHNLFAFDARALYASCVPATDMDLPCLIWQARYFKFNAGTSIRRRNDCTDFLKNTPYITHPTQRKIYLPGNYRNWPACRYER